MAKLRIGLIAPNKDLEPSIQEVSQQFGGCYIHHSHNILELGQKLALQKVGLILIVLPANGEGSELGPIYQFIRSKKDLQNVPIGLLTETPQIECRFLLTDPLVRAFPISSGVFMALLSLAPLVQTPGSAEKAVLSEEWIQREFNESLKSLSEEWIQREFNESLKSQVGLNINFEIRAADDDERRSAFLCQQTEEVRTSLAWFKINARLLETESDALGQLFQGVSEDLIEEMAQSLLVNVTADFKVKVMDEFSTRGAVYLPEMEKLDPQDRKWLYSHAKHQGILFAAKEARVLLEMSRYI
jgi:hypothetical protein